MNKSSLQPRSSVYNSVSSQRFILFGRGKTKDKPVSSPYPESCMDDDKDD